MQCNSKVNEGEAPGAGTEPADTRQWPTPDQPERLSAHSLQRVKAIDVRRFLPKWFLKINFLPY